MSLSSWALRRASGLPWALFLSFVLGGCAVDRSGLARDDGGRLPPADASLPDAGFVDASIRDGGGDDAGSRDAGPPPDGCVPRIETCDGTDEDCDGSIDESVTRSCANACGTAGTETCADGAWMACDAPPVPVETCDGTDEDCDGAIDEAVTRSCANACGAAGTETCADGAWMACDAPPVPVETCDGTDEDCDGSIDEALSRSCANACGAGTETCSDGAWMGCTAPSGTTETCDGTDQDCDGAIDEAPGTCACDRRVSPAGGTYQFCSGSVNWWTADGACRTAGYDLVTIDDATEDAWVMMTALSINDEDWWIGLRRDGGSMQWVSGSSAGYRNWDPGGGGRVAEPNDSDGEEDCVMFEDGSESYELRSHWADRRCWIDRPFVCEAP